MLCHYFIDYSWFYRQWHNAVLLFNVFVTCQNVAKSRNIYTLFINIKMHFLKGKCTLFLHRRGFVKEFEPLEKWMSEFEIHSCTLDFRNQFVHIAEGMMHLVKFWIKELTQIHSKNVTCLCGQVVSKIHLFTLILTFPWASKRVLTKSLHRKSKQKIPTYLEIYILTWSLKDKSI